jgi:transcription antitermination factor NusA-like protein
MERREVFYDRTFIENVGYVGTFKPLIINGELIGACFTGQDEATISQEENAFSSATFLIHGFTLWTKDPNFCYVVPEDKKKDWSKMPDDVYAEMTKHKDGEVHKINFKYLGTDYEMMYLYNAPIYSYLQFVFPVSDKYSSAPAAVTPMALAVAVIIIMLIIATNRLLNKIIKDVGGEPKFVKVTVDKIASGDMTDSDSPAAKKSTGILRSVYTMAENLKDVLQKIYDGANQLQVSSSEINKTTQTLSQNANVQASNADNIVSSMSLIGEEIRTNAEMTSKASKITHKVMDDIDTIKDAQEKSYKAVKDISEKIDIINWDENPARLIENALSPAKVISVVADSDDKSAKVIVPDYQLSLAIGREGQNARLAAKLTGYKIDIKSETQARESGDFPGLDDEYYDEEYYDEDDYTADDAEEFTEE